MTEEPSRFDLESELAELEEKSETLSLISVVVLVLVLTLLPTIGSPVASWLLGGGAGIVTALLVGRDLRRESRRRTLRKKIDRAIARRSEEASDRAEQLVSWHDELDRLEERKRGGGAMALFSLLTILVLAFAVQTGMPFDILLTALPLGVAVHLGLRKRKNRIRRYELEIRIDRITSDTGAGSLEGEPRVERVSAGPSATGMDVDSEVE